MNSQESSHTEALPILHPSARKPARVYLIHAIRLWLFLMILLLIRLQHQRQVGLLRAQNEAPQLNMAEVREVIPTAMTLSDWSPEGLARVLDESDQELATLLHTNRESREIVGYIGPTTLLVFLNPEGKVSEVRIWQSSDTDEHVDAIVEHRSFLQSWNGLTWEEVATQDDVDAVSGSTLTSFAIIQALRARFGGHVPSLKFPDPVDLKEIQQVWPNAAGFTPAEQNADWIQVHDQHDQTIGFFFRSSPRADDINGYQGPTDLLAFFDSAGRFQRMVIRSSYDNMTPEPFVDYVRKEDYFLVEQFAGMSRDEICGLDEIDVEGASGATMTSEGVFRALQRLSRETLREAEPSAAPKVHWNVTFRDAGVLIVILLATVMTFTKLKRHAAIKILFQCTLVVYLGFLNGDILSQTLLIGWVQNGVPWQNALGLIVLSMTAFAVPLFTKRNLYCQSICPFGAAQWIAAKTSRRKIKLPKKLHKWLRTLPAILICVIVLGCFLDWQLNLAAFEPFDAFHLRIAGWATLSIAVVGLGVSFFVPLAYCKYGCPTGAVLEYARRTGRSGYWGKRDWLVLGLVGLAGSLWLSGF